MSSKPFFFALDLSAPVSPALLRDLVSRVCAAASCEESQTADLTGQVEAAVAAATAAGPCELRFEAGHGTLDIIVQAGAGPLWQTSRPTV